VKLLDILLIWDIDGTLINCKGVGRKAMNEAFFNMYGIESGFDAVSMAGRLDELIVKEAMSIHGVNNPNMNEFYEAYAAALHSTMVLHQPHVLDGVKSILEETMRSGKVLNTVGTGNCEIGAQLKLEFTGLKEYIRFGSYGSDHDERWALVQDVIRQAEDKEGLRFEKDRIFVIGDTPRDIVAGQKNNVKTIAVETGGYNRDELRTYEPDFILPSLSNKNAFYRAIQLQNI